MRLSFSRLNLLLLLTLPVFTHLAQAGASSYLHKERVYQEAWCNYVRGVMEVPLQKDGRIVGRVDCVTKTHTIEVDFAEKWQEAVGQSIFYSILTGLKPGILLIIEKESDWKYYDRLGKVVEKYDIDVWFISPRLLETIENDKEVSR